MQTGEICQKNKEAQRQQANERNFFFFGGGEPICTKNKRIDFGLKLRGKLPFLIGFKMKSTYSDE